MVRKHEGLLIALQHIVQQELQHHWCLGFAGQPIRLGQQCVAAVRSAQLSHFSSQCLLQVRGRRLLQLLHDHLRHAAA